MQNLKKGENAPFNVIVRLCLKPRLLVASEALFCACGRLLAGFKDFYRLAILQHAAHALGDISV